MQEEKHIPRGPAATKAKNKYRDKAYDRMELAVPKGMKAVIDSAAKEANMSRTEFIISAVKEKMEKNSEIT